MRELDETINSDAIKGLKKKEIASINRRNSKLHRDLDGIAEMKKLPDVMVIVDICHDDIAVREANKLNIPTVAIVDTNSDPSTIDYPLAANDDAVKSIKVIMDVLVDAIKVANELNHKRIVEEQKAAEAEKAAAAKKAEEEKAAKAAEAAEKKKSADKDKTSKKPASKKAAPKKKVAKKPAAAKADDKKAKADKAEAKADKAEAKADKAETKADKAETKAEKAEAKAEKAEVKAEKADDK